MLHNLRICMCHNCARIILISLKRIQRKLGFTSTSFVVQLKLCLNPTFRLVYQAAHNYGK